MGVGSPSQQIVPGVRSRDTMTKTFNRIQSFLDRRLETWEEQLRLEDLTKRGTGHFLEWGRAATKMYNHEVHGGIDRNRRWKGIGKRLASRIRRFGRFIPEWWAQGGGPVSDEGRSVEIRWIGTEDCTRDSSESREVWRAEVWRDRILRAEDDRVDHSGRHIVEFLRRWVSQRTVYSIICTL